MALDDSCFPTCWGPDCEIYHCMPLARTILRRHTISHRLPLQYCLIQLRFALQCHVIQFRLAGPTENPRLSRTVGKNYLAWWLMVTQTAFLCRRLVPRLSRITGKDCLARKLMVTQVALVCRQFVQQLFPCHLCPGYWLASYSSLQQLLTGRLCPSR